MFEKLMALGKKEGMTGSDVVTILKQFDGRMAIQENYFD